MDTILKTAPAALSGGWRASPGHLLRRGFGAATQALILWQRRIQDREVLMSMNASRLRDIGLTQGDVRRETAKPFWRS